MAHILIAAAHKSSGKTTIATGLCRMLRARGMDVRPFKKGPDYIDPMWLSAAAGNPCFNLDFHCQSSDEILTTFAEHDRGGDISIIETNKGLHDGMDVEGADSNAALAKLLGAPVILVIDARGMTRGMAPLVLGMRAFDKDVNVAGVIFNLVGGPRHEEKLRAIMARYTDIPVLGAVHRNADIALNERHLGLVPQNELVESESRIEAQAHAIETQVDVDGILEIARRAHTVRAPHEQQKTASSDSTHPDMRIAIARDRAFGFYYPDDLAALQAAGAELVFFDTLHDASLPEDIDGLFIGGGFPETQMEHLQANAPLRHAICDAIEAGLPTYAECGGLMYLSRTITWQSKTCEMVGIIPADVKMHDKPMGRGYAMARQTSNLPWPAHASQPGNAPIHAHEFHYSGLENLPTDTTFAFEITRGTGTTGKADGLVYKNLVANYIHLRNVAAFPWAGRFAAFVRQHKTQRTD